jgi:endoglucanase
VSRNKNIVFAAALALTCGATAAAASTQWGVDDSGLEFGNGPKVWTNFAIPNPRYYLTLGVKLIRLPFKIERLQPQAGGPLDAGYVADIQSVIAADTQAGAITVLDPQNFGFYPIGGKAHDILADGQAGDDYVALMGQIARTFGREDVAIGLMNEPHTGADAAYAPLWNRAIAAIRQAGFHGMILVPHAHWSNAADIRPDKPYTGQIVDPDNHWALELHLYMDQDSTGTYRKPTVSAQIGAQRLAGAIAWSKQSGIPIFLGETNAPATPTGLAALQAVFDEVNASPGVFWGVALWGAGPWWKPDYPLRLDPIGGAEAPQITMLKKQL